MLLNRYSHIALLAYHPTKNIALLLDKSAREQNKKQKLGCSKPMLGAFTTSRLSETSVFAHTQTDSFLATHCVILPNAKTPRS